jgi:two-component system cell cycle sensor histidine kinase/response regulator CckA
MERYPDERAGLPHDGSPATAWLNQLPVPAVVLGGDGRVLAWNIAAAELMGWKASPAQPRLGSPRSPWLKRLVADVESTGIGRVLMTRTRGDVRTTVELRARRTGVSELLVVMRDCTPQLRSRRARAEQENRLRHFLDRLPEAALIEQHGRIIYANDAAARLMGVDRDTLTGATVGRFLDAGTLRRIRRLLGDEGASDSGPIEVALQRASGGSISAQIAALPLHYRRQPATQLLLRDLSAQRNAEASLRATHERLRLISETVRDHAILTVDGEGRVSSWNTSAERLTGYGADEMIRAPFAVLHTGTDDDVAALFDGAPGAGRREVEAELRRRDGSTFFAQITITPLSDTGEHLVGYAVVVRDLTERLHAEESLRRSEEQLRHSQKMDAVGRLAAGIAHDFNNILTAIQGHVQFLLEDLPADTESRDDATEIRKAADRATELTRQLLTFARKQPSRPVLLDVNDVIADLEKLLRRLIRADVALDTDYDDVPGVFVDPGHLEQVLVNLVVNARDAIVDSGRITISTARISLDSMYSARGLNLAPGEYVQIAVSDTGRGMSADMQRQIFEPFFTTKKEGTGLGLSTVYGIVKQAGGHISVYSEEGMGTTFKVFLPAQGPREGTPPSDGVTGRTARVLLVEDDDAVRALARRTLENSGFDVLDAADGGEALRIMQEQGGAIDVVVSDMTLPNLSGEDLAAQITEAQPHTGIVLMSGFPETSLVREGRISEQQRFLEKPFTPASLVSAVRDAMRAEDTARS